MSKGYSSRTIVAIFLVALVSLWLVSRENPSPESEGQAGVASDDRVARFDPDESMLPQATGESPYFTRQIASLLSEPADLTDERTRARLVAEVTRLDESHRDWMRAESSRLGLETSGTLPDGSPFILADIRDGKPVYQIEHNANAAISLGTDRVRQTAPFDADGDGITIGMWDLFYGRAGHQEFGSPSRLLFGEGFSGTNDHATHVAATMVAAGLNPQLKGMAPAGKVLSFNTINDFGEMTANGAAAPDEAGKLLISNHSYGLGLGWEGTRWWGQFSNDGDPTNDYEVEFGRYNDLAVSADGVTSNLPYYLPFFSAGNHGNNSAPLAGRTWNDGTNYYSYSPSQHPKGDDVYKNGYDLCEGKRLGKNVIAVGSVDDAVANGTRDPGNAILASLSSTGPADDGRIKPDIVANGVSVLSAGGGGNNFTSVISGTSVAAPGAAGSAALLVDYYRRHHAGLSMRASSLKGLILHTADDLGNPGPDYRYGWGLMNTLAAADLLRDEVENGALRLVEDRLSAGGGPATREVFATAGSTLRVSLCWTDPAGSEKPGHENREPALVNDLNLTLTGPDGTHLPFVMPYVGDWTLATIGQPATTGVNTVDNFEQVLVPDCAGGPYQITVDHTGPLQDSLQYYSLVLSGFSDPLLVAGDNVDLAIPEGDEVPPITYQLENLSTEPLAWRVETDSPFFELVPSEGLLSSGETITVALSVVPETGALAAGSYPATMVFTNVHTGVSNQFSMDLSVIHRPRLPLSEDFEDEPESFWSRSSNDAGGLVITSSNSPHGGTRHLSFDSSTPTGEFSENSLELLLDLRGGSDLQLSFWGREFGDESQIAPSGAYTGAAKFDGVSLSMDGEVWYPVFVFPLDFSTDTLFTIDLDDAVAQAGLAYNGQFRIRFSQYDNGAIPTDGIVLDDIRLEGSLPQSLAQWRLVHFGTSANSGIASDDADANGDGIPNLLAFASGLSPWEPARSPLALAVDGDNLVLTYRRSEGAVFENLVFTLEWSEDLSGEWSSLEGTSEILGSENSIDTIRMTLPRPDAERAFVRLRVLRM